MSETMERIVVLKQEIADIGGEEMTLPGDVMAAYVTKRPELLKIVDRGMDKSEVKAVMDALAGQLRLNMVLNQLIQAQETRIGEVIDRLERCRKLAGEASIQ